MGIKNLNTLILQYCEKSINTKHLSEYKKKKVAIDANVYIYKYLNSLNNLLEPRSIKIVKNTTNNKPTITIVD